MSKDNARFNEAFYFKARRLEPPGAYIDDKKFRIVKVNGKLEVKLVQKKVKVIISSSRTKKKTKNLKVNLRDEKSVDKMKVKKTKKSFERIKKKFNCDLCRTFFPSNVALGSHLQNFHIRKEEVKKFKCVKCSFSTTHCGNLKTHVKNVHEKIKRFDCDFCEKKFYRKNQIQLHLTSTHIKPKLFFDESRPYQCTFVNCSKYFTQKLELERHIKSHSGKLFLFN